MKKDTKIIIPAGEKLKAGQTIFAKGHGGWNGLRAYAVKPTLWQKVRR